MSSNGFVTGLGWAGLCEPGHKCIADSMGCRIYKSFPRDFSSEPVVLYSLPDMIFNQWSLHIQCIPPCHNGFVVGFTETSSALPHTHTRNNSIPGHDL